MVKDSAKRMVGTKDIPPRRGTIPLWIFRSLGISNNFFRKATTRIRGIINADRIIDINKDIAISR